MNISLLISILIFTLVNYSQDFTSDSLIINYRDDNYFRNTSPVNNTFISSSRFTELNPNIPRVDYLGIYFQDTITGWAVGANGAIIQSTDGGNKWSASVSNTINTLLDINLFDDKHMIAVGFNKTILKSSDRGHNWFEIQSGLGSNYWEIEIINDSAAFVCGTKGHLMKTEDKGVSWQRLSIGHEYLNFWSIDFINEKTGYISCDSGNVLFTNDGGKNWQLNSVGSFDHLYRIKMLSENHIVAGGNQGNVYFTFNNGITWGKSTLGSSVDAMAFINDSIGYAVGYSTPNYIYKTTSGGRSWIPIRSNDIGQYSLIFLNDSIGFNAGANLVIRKTTNGGNDWDIKIIKDRFINVWAVSEKVALAIGGGVYKTKDSGANWYPTFPYLPDNAGLNSIFFTDSLTGFVGTNNSGKIYKTTDAGETWESKNEAVFGKITDIFFADKKNGFASRSSGDFLKTTDYGETWNTVSTLVYGQAIQFFDSLNGYTVSSVLRKTSDGGITWIDLPFSIGNYNVLDLYFQNEQEGWILPFNHKLYYTGNGGLSWAAVNQVNNIGFAYFCWLLEGRGFITATNKLFETTDSGNSWNDITSEIGERTFNRMHVSHAYSGYAVGDMGLIVKYFDSTLIPLRVENIRETNRGYSYVYPNPFNNDSVLEFLSNENGVATIKIYNLLGEKIKILFNDYIEKERIYKIRIEASDLPSGVYFYIIKQTNFAKSGKLILMK